MSYRRRDGAWFIWWDGIDSWRISDLLGNLGADFWISDSEEIEGAYSPGGGALGTVTVTEI